MGAIRSAVASADNATEVQKQQSAQLEILAELAETKAQLMIASIQNDIINAGTGTNKTIPIVYIIDSTSETHAYSSSNATGISKAINTSIADFVGGGKQNIVSGISNLLSVAVTALFGAGTGSESQMTKYYAYPDGISLVRLDVRGWSRQVQATGLTTQFQQVSAFVAVKSSINAQKLDFNTFLDVYQNVLAASTPAGTRLTADQITKEISDARSVYKQLTSGND